MKAYYYYLRRHRAATTTIAITTIEINPEREGLIKKYLDKAGISDQVNVLIGSALDVLPDLSGTFDLVFGDGFESGTTSAWQ